MEIFLKSRKVKIDQLAFVFSPNLRETAEVRINDLGFTCAPITIRNHLR